MSDQEKKSGGSAIGSSVVMVEKTTASRHKQPYRPNELQYETEPHHKHPRAPAVPSVAEELKQLAEESTLPDSGEIKDRTGCDYAISADKHKQSFIKNLSSNTERRDHSPETITLAPIEAERKQKGISTPLPQTLPSTESDILEAEKEAVKKADEDSINDEITELQTPEMAKKHSEWSDDEEAGGLPRSDSRASRVSRMVRQFFCCGVAIEAPSEDNISTHRAFGI